MDDNDYDNVEVLVQGLNDQEFSLLSTHVDKWFSDGFDFADEYESMPYNSHIEIPLNGYDAAYRLFANHFLGEIYLTDGISLPDELLESDTENLFGVKIIEGEYPGSSYYAAELAIPIEEANRRAEAHDMPVRFQNT